VIPKRYLVERGMLYYSMHKGLLGQGRYVTDHRK
jgi:hypothetical protein